MDNFCEMNSTTHVDHKQDEETEVRIYEGPTRKTNFQQLVDEMNMKPYLISKLTLWDILSIGLESVHDKPPKTVADFPWNYLRKVMALNRSARDFLLVNDQSTDVDDKGDNGDDLDSLFNACLVSGDDPSSSIHPLDVLCVLLHCSDSFLQQEILTKMSMCQFAIPLLLPVGDGSHCTFMLGAMKDIVKKWRSQSLADSKGFREGTVVNTSMPIFSFVRLGEHKLSKSKILNQILNTAQLQNNFFIHDNMNGGNIERKISDGLVEISWYFPCGKSDVFPEPIAVTNLRGDLVTSCDQFTFLTRASTAVFIFVESISERELRLLSTCSTKDTQYYFIVTPGPGKTLSPQTAKTLKELSPILKLKKSNVIMHTGATNEAVFVSKLQNTIVHLLNNKPKETNVSKLEEETHELNIKVDENVPECQKAKKLVRELTREITDVSEYKTKNMVLQGELWKELSKVEKEMCRMMNQGGKDTEQYQDELRKKRISIHEEQYHHDLPRGLKLFIDAITHLSKTEKQHFLKWMKYELDSITRGQLSSLQAQYKDKCDDGLTSKEELGQIDKKISDSYLGIEHFLREMGQFYESECSMVKENKINETQRQFSGLPGIAAELLLDGFLLELIDGDASNIPLKWLIDVLTELDIKTGKKCRMRVITVLGVQSTGKSTLLNTMFGLQFQVASGRCTRGAFMTLLNVKENLQEELGCHFILVIDTEGLKSPELASLEDSYEHDNELSTLVVGLSDIAINNMAMENTTEMKDILQIVVQAFLRMKEVGKRPNCQFVHQNVSDVSAHDKNMRDRKKLLEQLDELTKVAAEMENKSEVKTFSDVLTYNPEKDNWYIPGLWLGVPPMAPVNTGYSEHVFELKKYLFEFLKQEESFQNPLSIPELKAWIISLWNSVKHENFIFSFRNSLVANAYNRLCIQYSDWDWEFRKEVYNWLIRTETNVRNQTEESLTDELCSEFTNNLDSLLLRKKREILELLEIYFSNKKENVHLIVQYKEDFNLSTESLRKELERNALTKFKETVSIQTGKFKIQEMKRSAQKLIEDKISDLLRKCREENLTLSTEELEGKFTEMWEKTMADLQIGQLTRQDVSKSMLQQLRFDMYRKGSFINEALLQRKNFAEDIKTDFKINKKHIESQLGKNKNDGDSKELHSKIKKVTDSLIRKCNSYIQEKVQTGEDYHDTYCQELLRMVNRDLKEAENLHFSSQFELDIKCHILGKASLEFQAMHDKFIEDNDPKRSLELLRPGYLKTFVSTFQEKDMCQNKAKEFCARCLKPAIHDYLFSQLGKKIVDDLLHDADCKKFSSRTFFQSFLMKELLNEMSFPKYIKYISSYEEYTQNWIRDYVEKKYVKSQSLKPLEEDILSSVIRGVRAALAEDDCLTSSSIRDFLRGVCRLLKNELVIPRDEINAVIFQNKATVKQFSSDIQMFLRDTETEILAELQSMDIKSVLSKVKIKPQDELFRKVVGCGKQCPFCKVPCEAGADQHKEHFAKIHRPQGLGKYRNVYSKVLCHDICTNAVVSNTRFINDLTGFLGHPYKEYRTLYPDWSIQPDASIESTDYWKHIFVIFNDQFAEEYNARPTDLPEGWKNITRKNVLDSLADVFNENP